MGLYTLTFSEVDAARLPDVGGKGANLGELTGAGFPVPPGFCVTTAAYRDFVRTSGELDALLDALDLLTHEDLGTIAALGGRIREHLGALAMPAGIRSAVLAAWQELGTGHAYAVRSSATAEDLPSASFAGQQDTFLNVRGEEQLLEAVRRCWASLSNRPILPPLGGLHRWLNPARPRGGKRRPRRRLGVGVRGADDTEKEVLAVG
jgi:pyruvate,water dikinase